MPYEVTELEVRGFLRMNVLKKQALKESNPEKYDELYKEANRLFPATDESCEMEISNKGDR